MLLETGMKEEVKEPKDMSFCKWTREKSRVPCDVVATDNWYNQSQNVIISFKSFVHMRVSRLEAETHSINISVCFCKLSGQGYELSAFCDDLPQHKFRIQ